MSFWEKGQVGTIYPPLWEIRVAIWPLNQPVGKGYLVESSRQPYIKLISWIQWQLDKAACCYIMSMPQTMLSECAPKRLIKVMTRIIKPCQHYFDPATITSQVKYVNVFCSSHGPLAFSNLDIIVDHAVMLSNKAMNSKAKRSARHAGVLDLGTTFKHLNCSIRRVPSQITQVWG